MDKEIKPIPQGPHGQERGNAQVVCVRMTRKLLAKICILAQEQGVNRSALIIHALKEITKDVDYD